MKNLSVFICIACLLLSACGGGSDRSTPSDPVVVTGSQTITVKVAEVSGATLASRATLGFAGVNVLDTQNNPVTAPLESPVGQLSTEITTTELINAQDLKVMVKAEGYVDTGTTVQLSEDETEYVVTVLMVEDKTGKTSDGIFTYVQNDLTGVSDEGTTTREISINLEESADTPKLSVTIPAGTQLMDDDGNLIAATSVSMVRFDPTQENVLDAYPGGLNVQADVNGVMEQVDFKSAGFASIVMKDSAGQKVKNFSQNIEIAMQLRIGTTDGDGNVVQADDIVPIWSYSEDEGTWVYEQDGTVTDLDTTDGLYDVVYQADHLTYFNLDWKTNACNATFEVRDNEGNIQNNTLKVDLKLNDYNIHQSFIYTGDGFISLTRIPESTDWVLEFRDPITNELIDTVSGNTAICGDRVINVDLPSDPSSPINLTEIEVGLYCAANLVATADVFVSDVDDILFNYMLTTNLAFGLTTGSDGILSIFNLPNTFIGKSLDVNLLPLGDNVELTRLGLSNTPGPFPVIVGADKEVNDIRLQMPEVYCQAGGFSPTIITASLTCPAGTVPNTNLETIPFSGAAIASITTPNSAISPILSGFDDEGRATLQLLNNTEYNLDVTPASPSVDVSITNPLVDEVIIGGQDKTYNFLLNDDYCSRETADETFTFTDESGVTITSTGINNPNGSIDFSDYFPTASTQFNYTTFFKNPNLPESQGSEFVEVDVVDNTIREVDANGDSETEYTIEPDKVRIVSFETDDDGNLQKEEDGAFGRFFNVGDQVRKTNYTGNVDFTSGTITSTLVYDLEQNCSLDEALTSFSQRGFSYSGDIIKLKCDFSGTLTSSNNVELGSTVITVNQSSFIYFESGIGQIAYIQDDCVPEGSFFGNNTPGCTVNQYDYSFLVE